MTEAVNRAELMERVDNDLEFLADTVAMFKEDVPPLLAQIEVGLAQQDAAMVAMAAHTLKGLVSNFCAENCTTAALHLEMMGKHGDLSGGPDALAHLQKQLHQVETELDKLLQGGET